MKDRNALEWLPILAKRHDEAAARIARLRSYTNGNPPAPEMTAKTRESWIMFQRKACMNLGGLVVVSAVELMRLNGITIGKGREEAELRARRILRDNRFDTVLSDALTWALTDGVAYLLTARDENGRAVITAESAEFVTAAADPLDQFRARAALKVWRDLDEGLDFAFVWDGTNRARFARPIRDREQKLITRVSGGDWTLVEVTEVGRVPLIILQPNPDGRGAFEHDTGIIDRAHLTILNRLVLTAMQAFRQRVIKGNLAAEDENGNPIDHSGDFSPAPGAVWNLPDGVDLMETGTTDITPILTSAKADLRDLAMATRTPISALDPDSANVSAEGARSAKDGLVNRVTGYLDRIRPAVELAIVRALALEDPEALTEDDTVSVEFISPRVFTDTERMNALTLAKAGDIPWKTRMRRFGGFSPAEIDEMEIERAEEMLNFALTEPAAPRAAA